MPQELLDGAKIDPAGVAAFVELHIEQGKNYKNCILDNSWITRG